MQFAKTSFRFQTKISDGLVVLCCRETLGLTRIASTKSFLAAKDGPPNMVSYPGWLGLADLGLFSLGFIPSLLGLFKVFDGDTHRYCCLSCFLFVPHYLDDFFCYQVPYRPPPSFPSHLRTV